MLGSNNFAFNVYKIVEKVEKNHWWFVGRRKIIASFITRYLQNNSKILDIGCGPGVEIKFLERYGKVVGIDSSPEILNFCKEKGIENVILGKAENLPFLNNSFDLATALDIVEHVEDDSKVIKEIYRVLRKGGLALITVPAFKFLWSDYDKFAGHWRRYNKKELEQTLTEAGFSILKISYFNIFLFLPIFLIRKIKNILKSAIKFSSAQELKCPPRLINKILSLIFSSERFLLRLLNFPFGVSLIAITSK